MAKAQSSSKAKSGQSTLAGFGFTGTSLKKKTQSTTNKSTKAPKATKEDEEDGDDYDDASEKKSEVESSDEDDDPEERTKVTGGDTKRSKRIDTSLPPINDIGEIFQDILKRTPELVAVADHLEGRKLRVATMCSGTESPLLALEMVQEALKSLYEKELLVEHVFSCEIEPFKQAYIERNFHPPLLFRDVCELGDKEAHTAYGALVPVPGDVDLLIAGTSCVDYSNLNTKKQGIDAKGESGRTFHGMLNWVKNHRPPLVILENVCSAPWAKVQKYFENAGYSASWSRLDTKEFYIPHTRTRGYLIAIDVAHSGLPQRCIDFVKEKKRPASSTIESFLLPNDHPKIHEGRAKLTKESYNANDRKSGRTDWTKCQFRHANARVDEALGAKRPATRWQEGGKCKLSSDSWHDWGASQVERVWDLMDIELLRAAKRDVDPAYKTYIWNLSQNVDRNVGTTNPGISPCLTPSMIPYITNRGGPMIGLEALSLQGLPIDKLLLTRETEDNLADLAGNAMSTTVVGMCILSSLIRGRKCLKTGDDEETYESKCGKEEPEAGENTMEVDEEVVAVVDDISGEERLQHRKINLAACSNEDLQTILSAAERSSRLCICEGRSDITTKAISRCSDCGGAVCERCYGHPEHNLVTLEFQDGERILPSEFINRLTASLPMTLVVRNVDQSTLDAAKSSVDASISNSIWSKWCTAVLAATQSQLRFVESRRQEQWTVVYQSPSASLELFLHPQQPEWRLFAKPEPSEPAGAHIREILRQPVARLRCSGALLSGPWAFALPSPAEIMLTIEGEGDLVPTWQNRLGLLEFDNSMQWSSLSVSVSDEDKAKLDRDISGKYDVLPRCGTANAGLHRRVSSPDDSLPSIFLIFDPDRISTDSDSYTFSISKRRYEHDEARPLLCRVKPSWRPSDKTGTQTVKCHVSYIWTVSESVQLATPVCQEVDFGAPNDTLELSTSDTQACQHAHAFLTATVDLEGQSGLEWGSDEFRTVTAIDERLVFQRIAWILEPARRFDGSFLAWHSLPEVQCADLQRCERCAPSPPALLWKLVNKSMVPFEDSSQAGSFERRIKSRPNPFVTQLRQTTDGVGQLRIGINIHTLLHRAVSVLPSKDRDSPIRFAWRLNTNYTPSVYTKLPKFTLKSNKDDPEHKQPPHFVLKLRPEQSRSLDWMIKREDANTTPFFEEEVVEACLLPIGWRVEGQVSRAVSVCGGVLADQVGYGKTAVTLALMDCTHKAIKKEFKERTPIHGKILTPATLVVVPSHLPGQWGSEVKKFLGGTFRVKVLHTKTDLNKLTIEDVMDADVVVVSATMFKSDIYLDSLSSLAGVCDPPRSDGRHFNTKLEELLKDLKDTTQILMDDGAAKFKKTVVNRKKKAMDAAAKAAEVHEQTKRLKGQKYRDAAEAAEKAPTKTITNRKVKPMKAKPNTKGLVPEVLIGASSSAGPSSPVSSQVSSPPATSVATDDDFEMQDVDSDTAVPNKRTRRPTKPIIISDDEEDMAVDSKPSKKSKGKKKQSGDDDSDFEAKSDEQSEVDEDEPSIDSDEDVPVKAKGKKATKARASTSSASTDVDMDEEDEDPKPVKKRKSTAGDDRPVKKPKVAPKIDHSERWGIDSKPVQRDWTQMKSPALEMFHFARVVVDEYTYLEGKIHSLVTNLTADRKWVLSGTPPVHDFAAVRTISAFLGIHLGISDNVHSLAQDKHDEKAARKMMKELSAAERFSSYNDTTTMEWQLHRQGVGQNFLDMFVRQNIAEIDEIPMTIKKVDITLPASEFALYLELEHHLRAQDMVLKKGTKKDGNDRQTRLNESLGNSSTAQEALIKACSHFRMDVEDKKAGDNAIHACDLIVNTRKGQLNKCKADVIEKLTEAVEMEKSLASAPIGETSFNVYLTHIRKGEGVDDAEAQQTVLELFSDAGVGPTRTKFKSADDVRESIKKDVLKLRETTHQIRRLTKELCGRIRSHRYFSAVRDLQKESEEPVVVDCPGCGRESVPVAEAALLSSCGHKGCLDCVTRRAAEQTCVDSSCKSNSGMTNIVHAGSLGKDHHAAEGVGKHYGKKLERAVEIIKKIPKNERILVFVQFGDLMQKVHACLTANGIKSLMIDGNSRNQSKNLTAYQENSGERVLLLNVMNESASGANLTNANHAIFLSPLLAPSREIYDACETQAIGRIRRYGQSKHVNIWQCVTANTIDQEIYEERHRKAAGSV